MTSGAVHVSVPATSPPKTLGLLNHGHGENDDASFFTGFGQSILDAAVRGSGMQGLLKSEQIPLLAHHDRHRNMHRHYQFPIKAITSRVLVEPSKEQVREVFVHNMNENS